jgi:glycosyltransferase involved in cell wall biosynthesis
MMSAKPKVLIATCGAWHLRNTAKTFDARDALAAIWCTEKNVTGINSSRFSRCWPFHLAMYPFYRLRAEAWIERAFYVFIPLWKSWLRSQSLPECNIVQSITGYGTEPFALADKIGALKVADCPNSHPVTSYGFWQRECDLWCPGEKVPVPQWLFARQNRELDLADLIVVQSIFCKEAMVLNGIPAEKVMVNPMGVDTSIFRKRTNVPDKSRFICIGTICLRKGHQYLFRAFELVKKKLPEAELICVGAYKRDFRMERPRWAGTFTHHPHLTQPELSNLMQNCTAFVFPSQEEGIARAQVEALACGLPLIGTHEGGATTLIRHGVEGFVVRGRDPANIAEAMVKLAEDRALNSRMGEAAYQKGAVKNTWQDYGDRLLAEYERRLEEKHMGSMR